jgi:uncharacterized protein YjbJ (UPF0337 family)
MGKQNSGKVREKWGKLTKDDLTVIAGKRGHLTREIQELFDITRQAAKERAKASAPHDPIRVFT